MKRKLALAVLLVVLAILSVAVASADNLGKVDVCHIPPGNPDNAHLINVSWNAVPAHLAHGDQLYTCDSDGGGPK